jgi:hypothetical protein
MRRVSHAVAVCILILTLYGMGVFVFPHFFDTYGITSLNEKIRSVKEKAEKVSAPEPKPLTLAERLRGALTGSEIYSGGKVMLEK